MSEVKNKIGQRILDLRLENEMTQEILAVKAGVSVRTLQHVEAGSNGVRIDILDKLADALGCDVRLVKRR